MAEVTDRGKRATDDWRLRALTQGGAISILALFGWLFFESDKLEAEQNHQQMLSLIQQCTGFSE